MVKNTKLFAIAVFLCHFHTLNCFFSLALERILNFEIVSSQEGEGIARTRERVASLKKRRNDEKKNAREARDDDDDQREHGQKW